MEIIASSSKGNCYLFGGKILIECGVSMDVIMRGCNFSAPAACIITHEHRDHSLSAKKIAGLGTPVIASRGTLKKIGIVGPVLEHLVLMTIDDIAVMPFKVEHDAAEPMAFVLSQGDRRVLFATDCRELPYQMKGLTEIFVECNYSEQLLLADKSMDDEALRRISQNHMSLERLVSFLKRNDLSRVERIVLLHLSDGHSDEVGFKTIVEKATGIPVTVARK